MPNLNTLLDRCVLLVPKPSSSYVGDPRRGPYQHPDLHLRPLRHAHQPQRPDGADPAPAPQWPLRRDHRQRDRRRRRQGGAAPPLPPLPGRPSTLALVPIFLASQLVVRGVPAVLFAGPLEHQWRQVAAAGLFSATSLSTPVAFSMIGVELRIITGGLPPPSSPPACSRRCCSLRWPWRCFPARTR